MTPGLTEAAEPRSQTKRLNGVDSLFMCLELPEQPMHGMALALLRPAEGDNGAPIPITLDELRHHVSQRLAVLPAFRLRVKRVPFGLHHPVFVEMSNLDLDYHLRRVTLPAPGGPTELAQLYASRAEQCLDRRYPLWRITLVEGLDQHRQALIFQIHHCLLDGAALRTTLSRLFSSEDAYPLTAPGSGPPARTPGGIRLVLGALAEHGRGLTRLPALVHKTRRGKAAIRHRTARTGIAVPQPGVDTPPCSLNNGSTSKWGFAQASLSLTDVTLVTSLTRVTMNDVVLCVVAGALRQYLARRNDLPDRPLVASVPVGLDIPGQPPRAVGNHISTFVTSLATNVADPWARLQTISAVTYEAKRRLLLLGQQVRCEWLNLVPPGILSAGLRRYNRRLRNHPDALHTNVTISFFRGPPQPWSFASTTVTKMYLTGPPTSSGGVTFTIWDYAGCLLVGISCADSVESPQELASELSRSLSELLTTARCHQEKSAALADQSADDPVR
jgi:diacylglycerol O-acyltransferase / wax synthase